MFYEYDKKVWVLCFLSKMAKGILLYSLLQEIFINLKKIIHLRPEKGEIIFELLIFKCCCKIVNVIKRIILRLCYYVISSRWCQEKH
jgi:hypothetical protein